ncbi:MAG TPA: hypothetical protein VGH40_10835 [Roseiarcus sp.]|jgi:hypothetical protein
MNALAAVAREVVGLFVDDGWLAAAIVAVVALAGLAAALVPNVYLPAGLILLVGCLGVLVANVLAAVRR